ncbi:MAG: septal ring lytic transglycosylase RlpA family protein [Acidobacteriota bacterium]|nr:septal ring lytic transglycosylase RlpA family protein [Acidobacteriota bacterium]
MPFLPQSAPARFRIAARATAVFALTACAALTAGCHHQARVAYQPPPPPVSARRVPTPEISARNTSKPPAGTPQSLQGFDDTSSPPVLTEFGVASWYGPPYHNHASADGTLFDQNALTAAHRTLPMGSTVRVTNVATNQSILVRITDRGPFVPGRVLDLSMGAAKAIGVWRPGIAQVKIEAFAHLNPDPAGRWCVQIGAFKSPDDALDLQADLMRRYKTAKVIEFTGPTGHWVRVNPAKPDLAHANEVAESLQSPDPTALPYVVRLD